VGEEYSTRELNLENIFPGKIKNLSPGIFLFNKRHRKRRPTNGRAQGSPLRVVGKGGQATFSLEDLADARNHKRVS